VFHIKTLQEYVSSPGVLGVPPNSLLQSRRALTLSDVQKSSVKKEHEALLIFH